MLGEEDDGAVIVVLSVEDVDPLKVLIDFRVEGGDLWEYFYILRNS